jgi:hypothetical protein
MKLLITASGWIVALAALALFVLQGNSTSKIVPAEEISLSASNTRDGAISPERAESRRLEKENTDLHEKLYQAQKKIAALEGTPVPEEDVLLGGEDARFASRERGGRGGRGDRGDRDDPEREARREAYMRERGNAMIDRRYRPLFEALALPEDVQESVRDIIASNSSGGRRASFEALREGTQTAKEVLAAKEVAQAALREQLGTVLGADELAAWDDHEANSRYEQTENMIEAQLIMRGANLDDDSRNQVAQVMAEELEFYTNAFEESDSIYNFENYRQVRAEATQSGIERLAESLPEQTFQQVETLVSGSGLLWDRGHGPGRGPSQR